jgi:hypothetical protein
VSENLPKIGLALTVMTHVDELIFRKWLLLLRSYYWPGPITSGRGQYVSQARNICIEDFIAADKAPGPIDDWEAGECEAMFFWDSDMLPPTVVRGAAGSLRLYTRHLQDLLVDNPDKDVFALLYFNRMTGFKQNKEGQIVEFPHEPVAYNRTPDGAYRYLSWEQMTEQVLTLEGRQRLHAIDGGGTGAMLIRKRVLYRMAEEGLTPWFENPDVPGGRSWTEDLYFCEKLRRLNPPVQVWLDSAGEAAHQGDRIWIQSQHYLAGRGQFGLTPDAAEAIKRAREQAEPKPLWSGKIILPDRG